jgi:hypothetical protein
VTAATLAAADSVAALREQDFTLFQRLFLTTGNMIQSALVAFNRPEAMIIFRASVEFLRENHPNLLPSESGAREGSGNVR